MLTVPGGRGQRKHRQGGGKVRLTWGPENLDTRLTKENRDMARDMARYHHAMAKTLGKLRKQKKERATSDFSFSWKWGSE